jgi:lipopolysaccharide/colanic/teichoic acid biosynthesis glycosyltransferase
MPQFMSFLIAAISLIFLLPLFVIICFLILIFSPGPVFFLHRRVGQYGRDFFVIKFRTMRVDSKSKNGMFTPGNTSRVTKIGKILRKLKIDELPQFINVFLGQMAVVGPRPEIRYWVDACPQEWEIIHSLKPGISDPASILYRNEEAILASAADPEKMYRDIILPHKLHLYKDYIKKRSFLGDVKIIFATIIALFGQEERGYL